MDTKPQAKEKLLGEQATCSGQLKKLSEEKPDKNAFIFIDKDWNKTVLTRKDVWDNSRKFAAILRRQGIKKGDIVCNTLVNSPERVITSLGTLVAGAISMHGQVSVADRSNLIHNLQVAKSKAIIVDGGHRDGALAIVKSIHYTDEKDGKDVYRDLSDLTTVIKVAVCCHGDETETFKRGLLCIEEEEDTFEELDITENDIAFVFSTSGTTGFSKQVPHTHQTCLHQGRLLGTLQGIESDESRYFSDRSLGWMGGYPGPYLVYGATQVVTDHWAGLPEEMDRHILKMLNEEKVESGVLLLRDVELLVTLINSGEKLNRRMRSIGVGGMPISKRVLEAFGVLSDAIVIGYGSTEVGFVSLLRLTAETPFEDYCIGTALHGFEIRILDVDGNDVPPRSIGQVRLRGPTTTPGYLNEPEKTRKAFTEDGFFLVDDTAYKDEEGLIYVLGRQSDAIHKGTIIHYPGWIESQILKCPGVEKVIILGVPDPVSHQEICACVVSSHDPSLMEENLQVFCRKTFLVDVQSEMSAMPKYFLFFESLPLNSNGKIDRKALKTAACARLDIQI